MKYSPFKYKKKVFDKKKLSFWAKSIKKRDGFKCKSCNCKGYLHSHHILPKGKFSQYAYELWNGVTLCVKCHMSARGVHGKQKPINKFIAKLRALMRLGRVSDVKKLTGSFEVFNLKLNPPPFKKKKVKYTLYKKKRYRRKLY